MVVVVVLKFKGSVGWGSVSAPSMSQPVAVGRRRGASYVTFPYTTFHNISSTLAFVCRVVR